MYRSLPRAHSKLYFVLQLLSRAGPLPVCGGGSCVHAGHHLPGSSPHCPTCSRLFGSTIGELRPSPSKQKKLWSALQILGCSCLFVNSYCILALFSSGVPSKHETLTRCWSDVGPASQTSIQHHRKWSNIRSALGQHYLVCCDGFENYVSK